MAKIRITENELKNIIRESVENELNEAWYNLGIRNRDEANKKWGYEWDPNKTNAQNRNARRLKRSDMKAAGIRDAATYDQHQQAIQQNAELTKQVTDLTTKNEELSKQVEGLNAQIQNLQGTIKQLRAANASLKMAAGAAKANAGTAGTSAGTGTPATQNTQPTTPAQPVSV